MKAKAIKTKKEVREEILQSALASARIEGIDVPVDVAAALLKQVEADCGLDEADMSELDRRWDNYLSGKSKTISVEDSMNNLMVHRKNRRKKEL